MPKLPKVFLFACLLQGMYHEQAQKHWPLLRLLLQNPNQLQNPYLDARRLFRRDPRGLLTSVSSSPHPRSATAMMTIVALWTTWKIFKKIFLSPFFFFLSPFF